MSTIFAPLENLIQDNKGNWPIDWVSVKGLEREIQKLGTDVVGCEIGTNYGWSVVYLFMNTKNIKHMYVIEPYAPYDDTVTGGMMVTKDVQNQIRQVCLHNLFKYADRITFLEKSSEEAFDLIKDDSLDFIFIDGDHSYDAVKRDVNLYYKKVKSGGIFAGHDYNLAKNHVGKAVDEFMEQNGLDKSLLNFGENDAWYFTKP